MTRENIHDWVTRIAGEAGDRTAVSTADRQVTYAELEAGSNRLANFLIASGMPRDARLGIVTDDVALAIEAVLAALKAGAIFVPLDPRTPERRLRALVTEVGIDWFVADARHAGLVENVAAGARVVDPSNVQMADSSRPAVDRQPDDPCYIYFTSGSTGQPKGILGRLKAIDHFVRWEIGSFSIGAGDRVSQLTTPSFDASLRDFFTPLAAGGTVCVPAPGTVLDAAQLASWLDDARINVMHCVPSVFRALLNEPLDGSRFAALRTILMAGEVIPTGDARRWFDIFGGRITLVNLYGPSETTMTKFFHVIAPADTERSRIPIGKPMPGCGALVVDEQGQPCPAGVVGEILIRTPYRSHGYFRRDDLTNAVFIQNPFNPDPNDLVYRTGDLGRQLKDGTFELIGRRDHQVKIRGERIELGAIEAVLRGHEAVKDAVVIDREDEGGSRYLCAYVVAGRDLAAGELRDFVSSEVSGAMIPSAFVVLEALPRLINGKVDRAALPAPDRDRPRADQIDEPRTPTEERLVALFAEVLSVSRVGVHESFFDLGGHSLLATQLVSRIRRAFDIALPVRALFDAPTVAGIARHVEAVLYTMRGTPAVTRAGVGELEI